MVYCFPLEVVDYQALFGISLDVNLNYSPLLLRYPQFGEVNKKRFICLIRIFS